MYIESYLSILLCLQGGRERGEDSPPWYLLGLVSAGSKYCGDGRPGLYTRWLGYQGPVYFYIRTESYLPWIRKIIGME